VGTRSAAWRTLLAAAVPVGLVLSAALVWQGTAAAFSASTDNSNNAWQTGSVVLGDNDSAVALFDTGVGHDGALQPLSTRSRCIRVDYTGSLPANIKFYVTTPAPVTTSLDSYLVMSVERGQNVSGTSTVLPDCTVGWSSQSTPVFVYNNAIASDTLSADPAKTLAALRAGAQNYGTGLAAGSSIAGGTSLTYRITYWVADNNSAQSKTSTANFVWEAQNTP
jgi:hypothetical protein